MEGGLHLSSQVLYDVNADQTLVNVSWQTTVTNNDPATERRDNGTIFFYESIQLPVLAGAQELTAVSADGTQLDVQLDAASATVDRATIRFDRQLFYQETYALQLSYRLPETRLPSLLVTPFYVFLPVLAGGDEATVTVQAPNTGPWESTLEPEGCTGDGLTLACAATGGGYVAGLLEVLRPDAITSATFLVPVSRQELTVNLAYFMTEEEAAAHVRDLAAAALPVIESIYGFPYTGPAAINIRQGGRQQVLGYEGLTSCHADACDIIISPIADDYTVLHELSHLWSAIYAERWLSEGFAQLVAEAAGGGLPPGLLRGSAPARNSSTVALQLDQWGDVSSVVGAAPEALAREQAGYEYSLRFLEQLRFRFGADILQQVNAAIAGDSAPADSKRFMDLLEETSGANSDDLFRLWVFPESFDPILADRREARDRLGQLRLRLAAEGLPADALTPIEQQVDAWRFQEALLALDQADANIARYVEVGAQLRALDADVQAAGLTLPEEIGEALARWDFQAAENLIAAAGNALAAYERAEAAVAAPRGIWERFGLIGNDPDAGLRRAAEAFERGEFTYSAQLSAGAERLVDNAGDVALRRMLAVSAVFGALALAVVLAIWLSRLRRGALAEQ